MKQDAKPNSTRFNMETPRPLISVIIPAYNREAYLAEAVQSALDQTLPPGEIIVVDDGSTDRTGEIARSFGGIVRCIRQDNQGVAYARNTGVAASCGEWIAFLDSDDLWVARKLEWQMAYLSEHSEIDLLFGQMKPFLSPELTPDSTSKFDEKIMDACNASALLTKKSTFENVGPFTWEPKNVEFIEWFSRAQDLRLKCAYLPEVIFHRRVHLSNTVNNRAHMKSVYVQALKQILDRRRSSIKSAS